MILETNLNKLGIDKYLKLKGMKKLKNSLFLTNRDNAKTESIKYFKNGSWIETKVLEFIINNKKYIVKWNIKNMEDKNVTFKNGKHFIKCLKVTNPKWSIEQL